MTKCEEAEIKQSLADRLRALQINQENWKNRIHKNSELEIENCYMKKRFSLEDGLFNKKIDQQADKVNKMASAQKAGKLADRVLSLEKSAKQWRSRVADKDNQKFTISGKMESFDYRVNNKERLNNSKIELTNTKIIAKNSNYSTKNSSSLISSHTSTGVLSIKKDSSLNGSPSSIKPQPLFTKVDSVDKQDLPIAKSTVLSTRTETKETIDCNQTNENRKSIDSRIEIPKLDDSFDKFFKPIKVEKVVSPSDERDEEDFLNEIDQMNSDLLVMKKNVKLKNRKASSGNPLKKMQNATDLLQDSYTESSDLNDLIGSPNKKINITHHSTSNPITITSSQTTPAYLQSAITTSKTSSLVRKDLDPTAKAALESKEDYQSVANKLKKSSDTQEYLDSNNLLTNRKATKILIQVKGRKKIQVRLVEPKLQSVNEGDSYVLIRSNLVIIWIGKFTNIIERTKVIEVGNKIHKRKELGFTGGKLIVIENDKKANLSQSDLNTFKNSIDENASSSLNQFSLAGNEEEDEIYENQMIKTNKVYIFDQVRQSFKLHESMCSRQLYQQQLNPYDAFFFDFDSEAYVWLGFHLSNDCRTAAIERAQELYAQEKRPDYGIFYKCNQNMELILFQEKFFDWTINYKHKSRSGSTDEGSKRMNLETFDIDEMLKEPNTVEFMLDNTNIGRGDFYKDENELLYIEVVTDNIKCWHINEYEKRLVTEGVGQFFDTETYVVRWEYRINRLGNLDKKRFASSNSQHSKLAKSTDDKSTENIFRKAERVNFRKHKETLDNNVTGRERFCYFYWQGSNCSIIGSGTAAALMAMELDKEKGTQIQVKQSEEPPCFLRLFKGQFVIYNNKHHQNTDDKPNRLFLVKGVYSAEAFLYEVKCDASSLRSRGCFVLVNFKLKKAFLWIGKSTNSDQIKVANDLLANINQHCFSILQLNSSKFTCQTIKQSYESLEFLDQFGGSLSRTRSVIRHLVTYDISQECAIFYLTSLPGNFTFKRLSCTYSSKDLVNNFPFEQKQLYSVSQPAFFLIDNGQVLYLWQGHFPVENEDHKLTGSITVRYSQEKKCALETVLSYSKKYHNKPIEAYLIHAGLEPADFIQQFPEWTVDEEIKAIQLKDGKKEGEMNSVREVLARVCNLKNVYKLEDLKKKPLPDGINALILETYLNDEEFEEVLKMSKKNFYLLPFWKQNKLKQNSGLF